MTALDLVRVATRGSPLALVQAGLVARALVAAGACRRTELVLVRTEGDDISEARADAGHEASDGQFTVAVEEAVLAGRADVAVHSYKDLPTQSHAELTICAVPERADPRDCLVSRHDGGLDGLPPRAVVGTGSARRTAQLLEARPDLRPAPIRGNVDSRRRRVAAAELDAVLLAAAGLDRLGVGAGDERLPLDVMLPAPAQGALAVQARTDCADLCRVVAAVDHAPSQLAADAERELLRLVGGGCLAPLGALVEVDAGAARLRAAYATGPGRLTRVDLGGPSADLPHLVAAAARQLAEPIRVPR